MAKRRQPEPFYVSARHAARMTLQSERVIWAACASGDLPARITTGKLKRYLIAPEDLRRWIDNMSAPVTPKEARQ